MARDHDPEKPRRDRRRRRGGAGRGSKGDVDDDIASVYSLSGGVPFVSPDKLLAETDAGSHVSTDRYQVTYTARYFAALLRALRQKRRSVLTSVVELCLPIVFVLVTVIVWALFSRSTEREANELSYERASSGIIADYYRQMMCANASMDPNHISIPNLAPCEFASYTVTCAGDESTLPVRGLCHSADVNLSTLLGIFLNSIVGVTAMVLPLDTIIIHQWIARKAFASGEIQNAYLTTSSGVINSRLNAILSSGLMSFVPQDNKTQAFMDYLNNTSLYFRFVNGGAFASVDEAMAAAKAKEQSMWCVVELRALDADNFDVVLHMNSSSLPDLHKTIDVQYPGGTQFDRGELYIASGFNAMQRSLYEYYIGHVAATKMPGTTPARVQAELQEVHPYVVGFGYIEYKPNLLLTTAAPIIAFALVLSFLYPTVQLVKSIVLEKELRIHEAMLIMGQRHTALYLTWFSLYAVQHLLECLVITIMLKLTYMRKTDAWCLFISFYVFALTTIPLAGCIAAFFSKARLAGMLTPLIYFAMSMPIFAFTTTSTAVLVGFSVLSPTAFASMLSNIIQLETSEGFMFADLHGNKFTPQTQIYLIMLIVEFVVYYLLTAYLDAVLPKEWGTRRHPLFFVRDPLRRLCGSSAQSRHSAGGGGEDGRYPDGVFEEEEDDDDDDTNDDGDDDGRSRRCSVRMVGLRKQYRRNGKPFLAVNNFYWRLREGEIAVLLGHNGAGKTTLMSMLTGMTSPDAGDCFIYGHSVREELSRARQLIGFCPQHNILWPELTCREHLEYYAAIKGLRGSVLQESVQAMLREVDLLDKIDYPSRALSGGQKRKLSIAIAFVGRSPLVFLDEPTAGMDVAARRFTWELLKRMARSHTILLSTHYMDEADLLGDTVAIMNHGRLQCCGTSLFLKARLGVGYELLITIAPDVEPDDVNGAVLANVPQARLVDFNGSDIKYKLDPESVALLPQVLSVLEKSSDELGVRGFSVTATTLEEVFLQLSMSKHAEEEGEDAAQSPASLRERGRAVWECSLMTGTAAMAWSQFKAMLRKRWLNGLRDRRMQCFQIVCPMLCILLAMLFTLVDMHTRVNLVISPDMFGQPVETLVSNCAPFFGQLNGSDATGGTVYNDLNFASGLDMSWYTIDTFSAHPLPRYTAMFCNDPNLFNITGTERAATLLFYNTSSFHTTALVVYQLYTQFYRHLLGTSDGGSNKSLRTTATLLVDESDGKLRGGVQVILISAIVMIPFTFLPSNPVAWVVKERECRARHLQRIAGLMFYVYWLSNYIYDVIAYVITSCLMLAIFAMFQRTEYVGPDTVGPFVVAMLEYGLCSTAMSYALSFFFHEHSSAQGSIMAFTFASGFLLVVLLFILSLNEDTKDVSRTLRWVFRLVPSFCIGEVIINLATNEQGKALHTWVEPWSMDIVGGPCIYMLAELPVFLLLTLLYDHPQWRIWMRGLRYKRTADAEVISDEDSDVDDERTEVYEQEANNHNEDLVRVVDLRKVYDNGKVAIRNLTFSILPHEVFGFLGTNGAGKTTTMSILCQEFLPTSGCAYVCAYDVAAESAEALRCIGYCPQFDATLDLLTVHDHLELYAGIRGIAYSERERVVDGIIQLCELSNYRNVLAHQLSGGNRRKLSVAIALVGGPPVVFLDEPSAGMDPVARRGLWNTIQTVSKDCSIVLTTHHLEEVEVLAHTIAIMANGTLRCIGDKTHLKQKYSSGYDLSLRLSDPELRYKVHSFVTRCCSEARLNEYKGNRLVYQLPSSTVLSTIFREMEANKARFRIADYSISQTSIEQVFLRISADARAKMLDRPTPPRFIRSHAVLRRYKGNSSAVRGGRPDSEWTTPSSLTSPSPTTLQTTMSRLTGQRQAMGSSPGTFQQQQQQVSPYDAVYDGATTADYTSSPHITFVVPPNDDFDYTDDVTAFDPSMGAAEANNATAMYVDNQGMNMYMGNAGAVYDDNNNNANAYFAGGNGQYNNNDAIDVEDDDDFVI